LTATLLKFVAVYCLFDTLIIIFAGAIKGAGDTRFVMKMLLILSITALVTPTYVALFVFNGGLYSAWVIVTLYVIIMSFCFLFRYISGKWKTMRVIEEPVVEVPTRVLPRPVRKV
jgi:MATE family multidrug resistance protein